MSADPPIPIDPDFRIQLPNFEGPLDLLLFLIQKHELDVIDLPVAFVTEKYVAYLGLMQRLNLDVAAEYLLMAATLAHIKSKSLLPPDPSRDAAEEAQQDEQDPRAELIRRLLEYQKYKKVAEDLGARGVAGRDVFTRGSNAVGPLGPPPLAEFSVFKLLDAFRKIAEQVKGEMALEVSAERITIQERITQIVEVLRARKTIAFEELFVGATTTYELVVSFLALLEMAKMRMLRIYQADPDSPIHLEGRLLDATDDGEDWAPREAAAEEAPSGPVEAPVEAAAVDPSEGFWPEGPGASVPEGEFWPSGDAPVAAEGSPEPDRPARPLSPRTSAPPAVGGEHEADPEAHFWPLDGRGEAQATPAWSPAGDFDEPPPPLRDEASPTTAEEPESFWPLGPSEADASVPPWPSSDAPPPRAPDDDPYRPAQPLPRRPSIAVPMHENEGDPEASFWPLERTEAAPADAQWPLGGTDLDSRPPPATDALDSGSETRQDPGLDAPNEPEESR